MKAFLFYFCISKHALFFPACGNALPSSTFPFVGLTSSILDVLPLCQECKDPLGLNSHTQLVLLGRFFIAKHGHTQTKCWLLGRSRRDVSVYRGRPELEAPKIDYSGPESGRIGVSRLYYYKSYILPTTYERALCSYERLILAVHTGRSSLGLPTV